MTKQEQKTHDTKNRAHRFILRTRQFYAAYTAGLEAGDFKKLFTTETKGVYEKFANTQSKGREGESRASRVFRSFGQILWGFMLSMSPARRFLYGIAFLIFLIASFVIITAPYGSEIRDDVATLIIYSFIIVSFLLALELADKLSAKDEIEIAREVQMSLLPPDDYKIPGFRVATLSAPAAEVGGDYYDFASVNGKICLAIGDVSGHGLGSGLMMAMAKSAWQAQLINDPSPINVLSTLNRIVMDSGSKRSLMTFMHCVIDPATGIMDFANAGHIYPFLFRSGEDRVVWLESTPTYPLGVRGNQKYENHSIELRQDDVLFFVSDGIIESMNEFGESFGYERFVKAAHKHIRQEPKDVINGILEELRAFVHNVPREDDLTLIVARYKPSDSIRMDES